MSIPAKKKEEIINNLKELFPELQPAFQSSTLDTQYLIFISNLINELDHDNLAIIDDKKKMQIKAMQRLQQASPTKKWYESQARFERRQHEEKRLTGLFNKLGELVEDYLKKEGTTAPYAENADLLDLYFRRIAWGEWEVKLNPIQTYQALRDGVEFITRLIDHEKKKNDGTGEEALAKISELFSDLVTLRHEFYRIKNKLDINPYETKEIENAVDKNNEFQQAFDALKSELALYIEKFNRDVENERKNTKGFFGWFNFGAKRRMAEHENKKAVYERVLANINASNIFDADKISKEANACAKNKEALELIDKIDLSFTTKAIARMFFDHGVLTTDSFAKLAIKLCHNDKHKEKAERFVQAIADEFFDVVCNKYDTSSNEYIKLKAFLATDGMLALIKEKNWPLTASIAEYEKLSGYYAKINNVPNIITKINDNSIDEVKSWAAGLPALLTELDKKYADTRLTDKNEACKKKAEQFIQAVANEFFVLIAKPDTSSDKYEKLKAFLATDGMLALIKEKNWLLTASLDEYEKLASYYKEVGNPVNIEHLESNILTPALEQVEPKAAALVDLINQLKQSSDSRLHVSLDWVTGTFSEKLLETFKLYLKGDSRATVTAIHQLNLKKLLTFTNEILKSLKPAERNLFWKKLGEGIKSYFDNKKTGEEIGKLLADILAVDKIGLFPQGEPQKSADENYLSLVVFLKEKRALVNTCEELKKNALLSSDPIATLDSQQIQEAAVSLLKTPGITALDDIQRVLGKEGQFQQGLFADLDTLSQSEGGEISDKGLKHRLSQRLQLINNSELRSLPLVGALNDKCVSKIKQKIESFNFSNNNTNRAEITQKRIPFSHYVNRLESVWPKDDRSLKESINSKSGEADDLLLSLVPGYEEAKRRYDHAVTFLKTGRYDASLLARFSEKIITLRQGKEASKYKASVLRQAKHLEFKENDLTGELTYGNLYFISFVLQSAVESLLIKQSETGDPATIESQKRKIADDLIDIGNAVWERIQNRLHPSFASSKENTIQNKNLFILIYLNLAHVLEYCAQDEANNQNDGLKKGCEIFFQRFNQLMKNSKDAANLFIDLPVSTLELIYESWQSNPKIEIRDVLGQSVNLKHFYNKPDRQLAKPSANVMPPRFLLAQMINQAVIDNVTVLAKGLCGLIVMSAPYQDSSEQAVIDAFAKTHYRFAYIIDSKQNVYFLDRAKLEENKHKSAKKESTLVDCGLNNAQREQVNAFVARKKKTFNNVSMGTDNPIDDNQKLTVEDLEELGFHIIEEQIAPSLSFDVDDNDLIITAITTDDVKQIEEIVHTTTNSNQPVETAYAKIREQLKEHIAFIWPKISEAKHNEIKADKELKLIIRNELVSALSAYKDSVFTTYAEGEHKKAFNDLHGRLEAYRTETREQTREDFYADKKKRDSTQINTHEITRCELERIISKYENEIEKEKELIAQCETMATDQNEPKTQGVFGKVKDWVTHAWGDLGKKIESTARPRLKAIYRGLDRSDTVKLKAGFEAMIQNCEGIITQHENAKRRAKNCLDKLERQWDKEFEEGQAIVNKCRKKSAEVTSSLQNLKDKNMSITGSESFLDEDMNLLLTQLKDNRYAEAVAFFKNRKAVEQALTNLAADKQVSDVTLHQIKIAEVIRALPKMVVVDVASLIEQQNSRRKYFAEMLRQINQGFVNAAGNKIGDILNAGNSQDIETKAQFTLFVDVLKNDPQLLSAVYKLAHASGINASAFYTELKIQNIPSLDQAIQQVEISVEDKLGHSLKEGNKFKDLSRSVIECTPMAYARLPIDPSQLFFNNNQPKKTSVPIEAQQQSEQEPLPKKPAQERAPLLASVALQLQQLVQQAEVHNQSESSQSSGYSSSEASPRSGQLSSKGSGSDESSSPRSTSSSAQVSPEKIRKSPNLFKQHPTEQQKVQTHSTSSLPSLASECATFGKTAAINQRHSDSALRKQTDDENEDVQGNEMFRLDM